MGVFPVSGTTIRFFWFPAHQGNGLLPSLLKRLVHVAVKRDRPGRFGDRPPTALAPDDPPQVVADGLLLGFRDSELRGNGRASAYQLRQAARGEDQPVGVVFGCFAPVFVTRNQGPQPFGQRRPTWLPRILNHLCGHDRPPVTRKLFAPILYEANSV